MKIGSLIFKTPIIIPISSLIRQNLSSRVRKQIVQKQTMQRYDYWCNGDDNRYRPVTILEQPVVLWIDVSIFIMNKY
jgi:hypothetical protein